MSASSKSSSNLLKKSASASLLSIEMTPSPKISSGSTSSTSIATVAPCSSVSPKKSICIGLIFPPLSLLTVQAELMMADSFRYPSKRQRLMVNKCDSVCLEERYVEEINGEDN
ncbi:hypothetical protein OWV82_006276 [Melia azedarach]|uniref:Uncharacterized protein n=1 Tax=Melia azedarach TaxID=155640 RepID=A0ACC1YH28_MELAZ|nr:hypothetical protein OWV82_006276 [Melia azedarach]